MGWSEEKEGKVSSRQGGRTQRGDKVRARLSGRTFLTNAPLPSGINSLRPELERALSPNAVQAKERQGEWGPGDDADVGGGENKGDSDK